MNEPEAGKVEEFRRAHAALNRTGTPPGPPPAQVQAEAIVEMSRQHENLAAQVRALVEQAEAREAAAAKKAARPRAARRPLAWSAALVLMVLAVCALAAWIGYLYFAR